MLLAEEVVNVRKEHQIDREMLLSLFLSCSLSIALGLF